MTLQICVDCGIHFFIEDGCRKCKGSSRGPIQGMSTAAFLLGLTLVGCGEDEKDSAGGIDQPAYGVAMIDADEDGFFDLDGDCDDSNAEINPDADEICDDGIDNDCDETIDSEDSDCVEDSG